MYPLVHGLLPFLEDLRVGSLELHEETIIVATRWSCHRDLPCGRTSLWSRPTEAITFNLELCGKLGANWKRRAWHQSLSSSPGGEPRSDNCPFQPQVDHQFSQSLALRLATHLSW